MDKSDGLALKSGLSECLFLVLKGLSAGNGEEYVSIQ